MHFNSREKRKRNTLWNTSIGTYSRDRWQRTGPLQRLLHDSYLAPTLLTTGSETKQEGVTVSLMSFYSRKGSPYTYNFKLNEKILWWLSHCDVRLNQNLGCLGFRISDNCLWNLRFFFFLWHFSKWKVTSPYKLENNCRLYKAREILNIKRVIKW